MKTAMVDYIEYLESIQERDNIPSWVITTARNYLELEKQQIMDAYCSVVGFENLLKDDAETYYNETFK